MLVEFSLKRLLTQPLPTQNSPPSSYHHTLGRRKLLIPPGSISSKICFLQQEKGVEETMICYDQNSVRKYEDDLEH